MIFVIFDIQNLNVGFSLIFDIRLSNLNVGFSLIFDIRLSNLMVEYHTSNQFLIYSHISNLLTEFCLITHFMSKFVRFCFQKALIIIR